MTLRDTTRRVAVLLAAAAVPLLASPAWADTKTDDGGDPGTPIAWTTALGIYLGIPALIAIVTTVVVMAARGRSGPRYRPSLSWWAAPVWLNAPVDQPAPGQALPPSMQPATLPAGVAAETGSPRVLPSPAAALATTTAQGGGASARW